MRTISFNYFLFLIIISVLLFSVSISSASSKAKYQYLPHVVQDTSFPIKESFYMMSKGNKLSKRVERKIERYLDINPRKVFNDRRISQIEKETEPLVYIALSQYGRGPVFMADRWGLAEDDPMYLFAVGLDNVSAKVRDMSKIKLEDYQELIEKPLLNSVLSSGHSKAKWEDYLAADIAARQDILYSIEFKNEKDINVTSYAMYVLSVSYMMMSRQDNNVKYAKENFDLLTRIFEVIQELKSVYDPNNPLLYFIAKKIEMRF